VTTMSNRIRRVRLIDRSLTPASAEVWVVVEPERTTETTEVRGKFTGPHSAYASTIEVAYPLRPFPRRPEELPPTSMRVPIPEASLWDVGNPFLYRGVIELWEDGKRCDQVTVEHGLRSIHVTARGLRLNGKPVELKKGDADIFHDGKGPRPLFNLLIVPVEAEDVWPRADRMGVLVLGRLDGSDESLYRAVKLSAHASCLGWLLPEGGIERERIASAFGEAKPLLGVACAHAASTPSAGFVLCEEGESAPVALPVLRWRPAIRS